MANVVQVLVSNCLPKATSNNFCYVTLEEVQGQRIYTAHNQHFHLQFMTPFSKTFATSTGLERLVAVALDLPSTSRCTTMKEI